MNFKQRHQQNDPLIICNVWDVASAKIAEELKFEAIGTSSAAIAASRGLKDAEELPFDELLCLVTRIANNSALPLTVDIEAGYERKPIKIVENIISLAQAGAIGINIEDSVVGLERTLVNSVEFAKSVSYIKKHLLGMGLEIFINVRVDTFLLGVPDCVSHTKERISLYESAGADGIFIPCLEKEQDIKEVVAMTDLPINIMCMPNLPDFKTLHELGVKRISMGNFIFDDMLLHLKRRLSSINVQQSFASIF